jgi:hypothetical protein
MRETYSAARRLGYSGWEALRFTILHSRLAMRDPPVNTWGETVPRAGDAPHVPDRDARS